MLILFQSVCSRRLWDGCQRYTSPVLSSKRTFHALDGRMLDVDVAVEEEAVEVDGFEGGEVVVCVLSAIVVGVVVVVEEEVGEDVGVDGAEVAVCVLLVVVVVVVVVVVAAFSAAACSDGPSRMSSLQCQTVMSVRKPPMPHHEVCRQNDNVILLRDLYSSQQCQAPMSVRKPAMPQNKVCNQTDNAILRDL